MARIARGARPAWRGPLVALAIAAAFGAVAWARHDKSTPKPGASGSAEAPPTQDPPPASSSSGEVQTQRLPALEEVPADPRLAGYWKTDPQAIPAAGAALRANLETLRAKLAQAGHGDWVGDPDRLVAEATSKMAATNVVFAKDKLAVTSAGETKTYPYRIVEREGNGIVIEMPPKQSLVRGSRARIEFEGTDTMRILTADRTPLIALRKQQRGT